MAININDKIVLAAMGDKEFTVTGLDISREDLSGCFNATIQACFYEKHKVYVGGNRPSMSGTCTRDIPILHNHDLAYAPKWKVVKPYSKSFHTFLIPTTLSKDKQYHLAECCAKLRREGRKLFRFKRWFLSLRFVNNWLWRRANKVRIYYCLKNECIRDDKGEAACSACDWRGYCRDVHPPQNTMLLPDYPSIRELSNERPNVQANQKN